MITFTDTYRPEGIETVKRVYNRAMRYQLDPSGQPLQIFEGSSKTLQTLDLRNSHYRVRLSSVWMN